MNRLYTYRPGNPDKQLATVFASDGTTTGTLYFIAPPVATPPFDGSIVLVGQDQFTIGGIGFPQDLQSVTDVGNSTTNPIIINSIGSDASLTVQHLGDSTAMYVLGPPGATNDFGATFAATGLATDKSVYYNSTLGGWTFEGNTGDLFKTFLSPVDPTANRFINIPNAGGTMAVSATSPINLDSAGNITFTGGTIPTLGNPSRTVNGTAVAGSGTVAAYANAGWALADPFTVSDGVQNWTGAFAATQFISTASSLSAENGIFNVKSSSTPSDPAQYITQRSRAGNTALQNGDTITSYRSTGHDGTTFRTAAVIQTVVDGVVGTNDMPGSIEFLTTPDGSSTPVIAAKIGSDQKFTFEGDIDVDGGDYKLGGIGSTGTFNGTVQANGQFTAHDNFFTDSDYTLGGGAGNTGTLHGSVTTGGGGGGGTTFTADDDVYVLGTGSSATGTMNGNVSIGTGTGIGVITGIRFATDTLPALSSSIVVSVPGVGSSSIVTATATSDTNTAGPILFAIPNSDQVEVFFTAGCTTPVTVCVTAIN